MGETQHRLQVVCWWEQDPEVLLNDPVLLPLNRRFGGLAPALEAQVQGLPVEQLEALAEALLDFRDGAD
ncbi:DUF4351 domain-containing protein [Trichothermofontia sp.]